MQLTYLRLSNIFEYMAYQFKVTLEGINPPIWRRFQVPKTSTMGEFSFAIEDSMKWSGTFFHRFIIEKSIPLPDYDSGEGYYMLENIMLSDMIHYTMEYEYNISDEIGNGWMHVIEYEGEVESTCVHPVCINGERACPPDSLKGYAKAYDDFLKIVMDKDHHDRYEVLSDYYITDFHPEVFDKNSVRYRKYIRLGKKQYWNF